VTRFMKKRVFLIVLDSFGIGELPDAAEFGDVGSHTLRSVSSQNEFYCPNLTSLGLFNIEGCAVSGHCPILMPLASYGRMASLSRGKDTTTGHWELAGVVSDSPMPTYPNGFPEEIIKKFENLTGKKVLCNMPYSGTQVIADFGEQHLKEDSLIVYTSADSVFQIAAHIDKVPLDELYRYCEIAREMLTGEHGVGRVIARPFGSSYPFERLPGRHDYSIAPPKATMLDELKKRGFEVISVGKIFDIFSGCGITESYPTSSDREGMAYALSLQKKDFEGLCFVNLVEFDSVYGHRNNAPGYAAAISEFDKELGSFMSGMRENDLLIITADHGCDPLTPSTDHSREYVPLLIYGNMPISDLGTKPSFSFVSSIVLDYLK